MAMHKTWGVPRNGSYLSVWMGICSHNWAKIERSKQVFILPPISCEEYKWEGHGTHNRAVRLHVCCYLWPKNFFIQTLFLTLFMSQSQAGSHTRAATCVAKLIVGTWLPTGLLWVSLEQVPILTHARPSFKGGMIHKHKLDIWYCVRCIYIKPVQFNCSSQMFICSAGSATYG